MRVAIRLVFAVALILTVGIGCRAKKSAPVTPPPLPPPATTQPVAPPPPPTTTVTAPVSRLPVRGNMIEPSSTKPADFARSPEIEVFGNFHTAGIIAKLPQDMAPASIGGMRGYLNVGGKWQPVQDLVQVGAFDWFASSLFWLKPASTYQVKVVVLGTTGQTNVTWYGEGTTRSEPVVRETAAKVYVATTGDDTHAGTLEQPFKTLKHAFETMQPGRTIVVREGRYFEGDLEFVCKGNEAAPLIVRAYPGERVVLDGSDQGALAASAWQAEEAGIYGYPFDSDVGCASVIGKHDGKVLRVFPVKTLDELRKRTINDPSGNQLGGPFGKLGIEAAIFFDGARAHLWVPGPINDYEIHIPHWHRGINIDTRNSVKIEGLEFWHYGKGGYSTAIYARNANDLLIQKCTFVLDDCQIFLKGNSDRVTVQDCTFRDYLMSWPFGYMKNESGISGMYEGGSVNVDAVFSGRGLVYRRNHVEGLFDGARFTPFIVDEARTQETDVYQNTFDGCIDDFIELDGFSRNVRVFDNFMIRSLSGISIAQALDGPTYIVYNVLGNCGMVPAAQREENYGYPFKTNGGPGDDIGSGPVYFYHNTAYTLDPKSRAILIKTAVWRKFTMRNNIWCGNEMGADIWQNPLSPMDFDYDNLYVSNTNAPLVLHAYHTRYNNLGIVQRRLKWLKNGISAEPRIQDAATGNFHLKSDSPCIDKGAVVAGINEARMQGVAPDMGAYEAR